MAFKIYIAKKAWIIQNSSYLAPKKNPGKVGNLVHVTVRRRKNVWVECLVSQAGIVTPLFLWLGNQDSGFISFFSSPF